MPLARHIEAPEPQVDDRVAIFEGFIGQLDGDVEVRVRRLGDGEHVHLRQRRGVFRCGTKPAHGRWAVDARADCVGHRSGVRQAVGAAAAHHFFAIHRHSGGRGRGDKQAEAAVGRHDVVLGLQILFVQVELDTQSAGFVGRIGHAVRDLCHELVTADGLGRAEPEVDQVGRPVPMIGFSPSVRDGIEPAVGQVRLVDGFQQLAAAISLAFGDAKAGTGHKRSERARRFNHQRFIRGGDGGAKIVHDEGDEFVGVAAERLAGERDAGFLREGRRGGEHQRKDHHHNNNLVHLGKGTHEFILHAVGGWPDVGTAKRRLQTYTIDTSV